MESDHHWLIVRSVNLNGRYRFTIAKDGHQTSIPTSRGFTLSWLSMPVFVPFPPLVP
jgi:hypothetical protein